MCAHTDRYFGNNKCLRKYPAPRRTCLPYSTLTSFFAQSRLCLSENTHPSCQGPTPSAAVSSGGRMRTYSAGFPSFYCLPLQEPGALMSVFLQPQADARRQPRPQQTSSPGWGGRSLCCLLAHIRARPLWVSPRSAWSSQQGRS